MRNIFTVSIVTILLVYMLGFSIQTDAQTSDKISVTEYTPFDEVLITIFSPDNNQNHDVIESIEASVSSSSDSIGRVKFVETGPNTGIFDREIKLTPNKEMFFGELEVKREDGITIEFRIDENTVVTKSVFVNYHFAVASFDKQVYKINDSAIIRVIDPDMNMNPNTIDTVKVRLWSTTDRGGLQVTLRETGDRTGVFEEIVTFTLDQESTGTRLRVSEGDTVTVKYSDNTLPAPAALDSDGVFTVEVEENFAHASISSLPQLERAPASDVELLDLKGEPLTDVNAGIQVLIQSTVYNAQMSRQSFAHIVQVTDSDGVTVSLSWVYGEIPSKESLKLAQSWIPSVKGNYKIETFVWESIDNPTALSPKRTLTVSVM